MFGVHEPGSCGRVLREDFHPLLFLKSVALLDFTMQTRQRPRVCQIEGEIFFLFFFFFWSIFSFCELTNVESARLVFLVSLFFRPHSAMTTDFMAKNLIKLVFFFPV